MKKCLLLLLFVLPVSLQCMEIDSDKEPAIDYHVNALEKDLVEMCKVQKKLTTSSKAKSFLKKRIKQTKREIISKMSGNISRVIPLNLVDPIAEIVTKRRCGYRPEKVCCHLSSDRRYMVVIPSNMLSPVPFGTDQYFENIFDLVEGKEYRIGKKGFEPIEFIHDNQYLKYTNTPDVMREKLKSHPSFSHLQNVDEIFDLNDEK